MWKRKGFSTAKKTKMWIFFVNFFNKTEKRSKTGVFLLKKQKIVDKNCILAQQEDTFPQEMVWITLKIVEKADKNYVEICNFIKSYPQTFVFLC